MTARSRTAGVTASRGSAPDLRRVVDLQQRHASTTSTGGVTLTSAQHHGSVGGLDATCNEPVSGNSEPDNISEPPQTSHNGVVIATKHHHQQDQQQQQLGTAAAAAATSVSLDDVFRITEHVAVDFDDIFVHPEVLRNGDIGRFLTVPVRRVFGYVFTYTQEAVYYFLSIVSGLVFGVAWGSVFGLLDFVTIWLAQPLISVYCMLLRTVSMPLRATVRCLFDPVFQSTAHTLRHVSLRCFVQSAMSPAHGTQQRDVIDQQQLQQQQSASGAPVEWLGYV